jgi:mannose-6-phosphate isomerase-like protein (cupin superfamily)
MAGPVHPFVVAPGAGETIRGPAGGPATFKARAETTNGTFTALENIIAPGQGPPLHIHIREDEMYYILGGHLRFKADDQFFDAPAGSFMFIPRGTPHCFQNVGPDPAKMLVMFTPAGMERFFEGQAALPAGPVDPNAYRAAAHSAWMQVIGPPLAASDPHQTPE